MRALAVACAVACSALLAPTAGAADWLPATDLAAPVADVSGQRIVTTADGTTFIAWVAKESAPDTARRIVIRRVGADGVPGGIATVTEAQGDVADLSLVTTPGGGVLAAWRQSTAVVRAQRIGPDGLPIGEPFNLHHAGESDIDSLFVAPGPGGPVAVWESTVAVPSTTRTVRMVRVPATGPPAAPTPLPGGNDPSIGETAVAVSPDDSAWVVWNTLGGEANRYLRAVRISPQGTAGGLHDLLAGGPALRNITLVPGSGNQTWISAFSDVGGGADTVHLWRAPAADQPPDEIGSDAEGAMEPESLSMAATPGGGAFLAWIRFDEPSPGDRDLRLMRVGAQAGALPPPVTLAIPASSSPSDLRLAGGTDGSAMLAHRAVIGGVAQIRALRVGADHTPAPARTLSRVDLPGTEDPYDPALAAAPNGEYAAAWGFDPGATDPDRVTQYAHFDATAPVLTATIPATATVGEPKDFSVNVADRADAEPLTYAWDFGDGAGSSDADPEHTYASPGTRTVTVRVTDRAGNSAQRSGEIVVTAPATPGPTPGPLEPVATPDLTAPVIDGLSVTPRVAVRGTTRQTTRRVRIAYRLNEAARVRARFDRRAPGLRRGRACVAPSAALRRSRARACVRFVRVATLTRSGAAGANRIDIARLRVGTRTLVPGVHRITLTATDVSGNRSASRATTLTVRRAPQR